MVWDYTLGFQTLRVLRGRQHGHCAFCSPVRWEIKTYSKVTSDFASDANETTAGIKLIVILGADNSLNWCNYTVAKHLQLMVSNEVQAALHLNAHLDDDLPPNASHRQTQCIC